MTRTITLTENNIKYSDPVDIENNIKYSDPVDTLTALIYLDHILIDALLAGETRPRILEFTEGALMILRGVNLNENAQPEDMVSIRLWIDKSRIISIERRHLKAIRDIQKTLAAGNGPRNSGDFIAIMRL